MYSAFVKQIEMELLSDATIWLGYEGWTIVFDHLNLRGIAKSQLWLVNKNMSSMVSSWFRMWTTKWGPRLGDDGFYIPKKNELRFDPVYRRWIVKLTDLDPIFDDWMEDVRRPAWQQQTKKQVRKAKMKSIRELSKRHQITINMDGLELDESVNHVLRVAPLYRRALISKELPIWKGQRAIVVKKYDTLLGHLRRIWNEGKANVGKRSWLLLWRFLIWGF